MKNDSINMQTDEMLPPVIKPAEQDKNKKKLKDKSRDKPKNKTVK